MTLNYGFLANRFLSVRDGGKRKNDKKIQKKETKCQHYKNVQIVK